jgi:uncharacterized lipoprotein YddW (UPF0748 family)
VAAGGADRAGIAMVDRRSFLGSIGGAVAGLAFGRGMRASGPFAAWTWVHGGGAVELAEWRARYARLRESGVTGVLVSGGDLGMHIEAGRGAGVAVHRWIWALNRSGDARVKAEHPEWFSVSRGGLSSLTYPPYVGYYQWLCPSREAVRAYLADEVRRLAATPGLAGVHLDYIRHPDVILPAALWERYHVVQDREYAAWDFCYCEECRRQFRERTGRDPLAIADPATDPEWRRFRWDGVTAVVGALSQAAHGQGRAISAAVFPTPTLARRLVRQAWDEWPVDAVFPMLYHRFYREDVAWIGRAAREGVAALRGRRPLHAGLYLPDLAPDELARAVRVAREAGASGVACFELRGLTDAHLAALRTALAG